MWGKREIMYLSLHCHYQNDFCVKMGSDAALLFSFMVLNVHGGEMAY